MTSQTPSNSAPSQSSFSFTQGFILGQISVVLFIGAFIKFFIFGEPPPPRSRTSTFRTSSQKRTRTPSLYDSATSTSPGRSLRHKPSTNNILRPIQASSTDTASILRKTYYQTDSTSIASGGHRRGQSQHSSHQPESLDWFNVLIAQTIAQYRQTAYNLRDTSPSEAPSILTSLTAALNNPEKKPSFLDTINITEISLGEEFPIFSNCRVIAIDDDGPPGQTGGRLQALMDVDLSDDNLTLGIETSLILNYPKPFSAVLPVALGVSVVKFSGTLCISFIPAAAPSTPTDATDNPNNRNSSPKTNLAFSFLPDYRLELSVRSLVGSRSRLQDVPKIAQLVESRVLAWFEERVVEPRVQVVGLPGLWPRIGRTGVRGGDDGRPENQDSGRSEAIGVRREDLPAVNELEGLRWRGGTGVETPGDESASRMPGFLPGMTRVA